MQGLSTVGILDKKGKSLVTKHYRNDLASTWLETFNKKMIEENEESRAPMFQSKGVTYFYKKHADVTLVGAGKGEQDAVESVSFLDAIESLLIEFFGQLEVESVRDNLILVYELLDEMADNGKPQNTDLKQLKNLVTSNAKKLKKEKKKIRKGKVPVTSVPWRTQVYKYSKNEVYLDVIEKISMLVNANGQVLKSEVDGTLHMNCKLSGTPELILGLNDKKFFEIGTVKTTRKKTVDIQDIKFHQCVRLAKFENDRTISFVPPDGEFDLISYRMQCPYKSLFALSISHTLETDTACHFTVTVRTNYKKKVSSNFVEFRVPVPADCQALKTKCSRGRAKHMPDQNVVAWKLNSFPGKKEATMSVRLTRPSLKAGLQSYKARPVNVHFDIAHYTLSGLNVRYLKIKEKSNYHSLSWVRYVAKNGQFVIRTRDISV